MDNSKKNFGMRILYGPSDYQIIQHRNGLADISLSGDYIINEQFIGELICCIRVVSETDNMEILTWTECEINKVSDFFGLWSLELHNVKAGGPYRIESGIAVEINDMSKEFMLRGDIIHHVGIGNIVVVAGQSNSTGYAREAVYDPPEYGISVLTLSGKWKLAVHPLNDATQAKQDYCTDILNVGHSPWLSLAKSIKHHTNLPVGIIPLGLGGSEIDLWNPGNGVLFRNMINTIKQTGDDIFCFIWYQGCSDIRKDRYLLYHDKLIEFFKGLRNKLGNGALPIINIQLNRSISEDEENAQGWRIIREAQRTATKELPNIYCIPTYDIGIMSDDIHNSSYGNIAIAQRAFTTIKGIISGEEPVCAPDVEYVQSDENREIAIVKIKNVVGSIELRKYKNKSWPFVIEESNGRVAENVNYSMQDNNTILIQAAQCLKGMFISYVDTALFEGAPLYDSATRLPLLAFNRILIN